MGEILDARRHQVARSLGEDGRVRDEPHILTLGLVAFASNGVGIQGGIQLD
jgi:hypothetical protein